FSQEDLIKLFDEQRLSKSAAGFDAKKLAWINNQYMKQMGLGELTDMCIPYLLADGGVEQNPSPEKIVWLKQLVSLY
ncbi:glutamate--tRNA ligase, partial [Enterococcus faecalis]